MVIRSKYGFKKWVGCKYSCQVEVLGYLSRLWVFCSLLPSKSGEWKEHAVPGASLDGGNNFFRKVFKVVLFVRSP